MKRIFAFISLFALATLVSAQAVTYIASAVKTSASAPSGACSPRGAVRAYASSIYLCPQSGTATWTQTGSNNDPTPAYASLTDAATVTWVFTAPQLVGNAKVTLGGARTLSITGCTSGCTGTLIVTQDGTGGRTLTLPAGSLVNGGGSGAVTLSSAAAAKDVLTFTYDGTNYFWTVGNNFN